MRAGTYASRVHLAARSEHFRAMLYGGMLENFRETCREGVELKDVSYVVFLKILEFLYTETVLDIPPDVAVPLLIAAEQTCARPFFSPSNQAYDVALRNVKRRRNARFRGLVRFVLLLEATATPATTTPGTTTPATTTPEREGRTRSDATCSGVGRGAGMADTP